MRSSKANDLIVLFGHVPLLLDACVLDQAPVVRCLRLVNRESSRVALLGLKSYVLSLRGDTKDTNVSGATLLQHTKLQSLHVKLLLTETYSPAILLKAFLHEVGSSLCTVTQLHISCTDTCGSLIATSALTQALSALVAACPAATLVNAPIRCLSNTVMQSLRSACQHLSALYIRLTGDEDGLLLQQVVDMLPSLLPNVHRISFQGSSSYTLPDMSQATSLISLMLRGYTFKSPSDWTRLPPKLAKLRCFGMNVGPPTACADQECVLLASLHHLIVVNTTGTPLHAVAQLLRAAPSVQFMEENGGGYDENDAFVIKCIVDSSTAVDLSLLLLHPKMNLLRNAVYKFSAGSSQESSDTLAHLTSHIPCMKGIARCAFDSLSTAVLEALLSMFPDAISLHLANMQELDDKGLHVVASSCASLASLKLYNCSGLTPGGLVPLCLRLPTLCSVTSMHCLQLTHPALGRSQELLLKYGANVVFLDKTEEIDESD